MGGNGMKGQEALFSHNSDEWETPKILFQDLQQTHNIQVDTACRSTNAKCKMALTIDRGIDGLKFPWHEIPVLQKGASAFTNPPHSTVDEWIAKAIDESREGIKVVMLIPANIDTSWWHSLVRPCAAEIYEVLHRVHFYGRIKVPKQPKDTPKDQIKYEMGTAPAPFASAIVVFDTSVPRNVERKQYVQVRDRKEVKNVGSE
jgi:phage N-6-adenine-methyltransferase